MSAEQNGGPAFPICPGQDGALAQKFLARVDGGDWSVDRCWEWQGATTPKGYGVFAPSKRVQYRAHRFSLQIYLGRSPTKMVLHKCDNPRCVNPLHLEEGEHGDNMRQMADRKRAAREERHHKAKLAWAEVIAIVLLHRTGHYPTRELAKWFGMNQSTIAAIIKGDLWPDAYAYADAMLRAREER
jgi:hypothetical protein